MSDKVLLREFFEMSSDDSLLTEADKKRISEGELIMAGVMQRADAENGNGRVYPEDILRREIQNYKKIVGENRALGELDHPDSSVVELKNASHIVTEIEMRGKDVIGKVKVLDTPSGRILKDLIRGGVKLGISSRGLGSVKSNSGRNLVQEDFQLICFDFVSDPSTVGAFMIAEGKSHTSNIFTRADRINRVLNDIFRD
jgi:hypothetical protein